MILIKVLYPVDVRGSRRYIGGSPVQLQFLLDGGG